MILFIAAIFGLMIGSFLNVCIHRLPNEESVVTPRSHCVKCKKTISWYDNIPVLSYIALGGKCRFCKEKISARYLIVEIITAFIFVFLISQLGLNSVTIIYIALTCALIVATFIDFKYQIIPDEITYGGMIVGIVLSVIFPQLHNTANRLYALGSSLLGLLAGGALIYALATLGTIAFRKKLKEIGEESAMGGGDVKYLAMIGAFLGWQGALFVFFIAPFFGGVVGIIEKLRKKADIIPYGPYLSVATVVVIVWGDEILKRLFPYLG